jgi:opacity protein-like surface antigen
LYRHHFIDINGDKMNTFFGLLCLGVSASLLTMTAQAADEKPNYKIGYDYEFTPYGGYHMGGSFEDATDESRRELRDGSSFGVLMHLVQVKGAYYEFNYEKQTTELQGANPFDLSIEYFQVGGTVEFAQPEDRVRTYLVLTVGATRFAPEPSELEEETAASMSLGVGAKIPVAEHVAIRLEARAYVSFLNADSDVFCAGTSDATTCAISAQSDYFVQARALLGVTIGF